MKFKQRMMGLLAVLLVMMLSGCSSSSSGQGGASGVYPMTIQDSYERQVTVAKLPERIISLAPSNTEILFALGLGDRIVGVTDACNYPPEAQLLEKVSSYQGPNMEKIVAANPDLILADSLTGKEVVEQLAAAGFPVMAVRSDNIPQLESNIRLIGQLTQSESQADQLVNSMDARLQRIDERIASIPEAERVTVFYEVWNEPLMSAGPNSFVSALISAAGGKSVTDDALSDWPTVEMESLIIKNPQVIILGHGAETPEQVQQRTVWQTIAAVEDGRVYTVDPDIFNRPSPRLVDAVEELAKLLYPELFK
jgi:iron complex transport system substrate-binding protein